MESRAVERRKMESAEQLRVPVCSLCGENYSLPEEDVEGNLPRVLLCGHIYCSSCLRPLEHNNTIVCPQCEMESTLPQAGVDGLTEDCRIIGLLYTSKMNKKRSPRSGRHPHSRRRGTQKDDQQRDNESDHPADLKKFEQEVDEALVRAAENMAQLESVRQTLETGLKKQVSREKSRLQSEISQAASKAIHSIRKWKDREMEKLSTVESLFVQTKCQLQQVEQRVSSLQLAIQKAREVRRVPFLEKYCPLDQVVETLQASVENQFDLNCLEELSERRFSLNSQTGKHSLTQVLDFSTNQNNDIASPVQCHQANGKTNGSSLSKCLSGSSTGSRSPSSAGSSSPSVSHHGSTSDLGPGGNADGSPDIIIEEMMEDGPQHSQFTLPPVESQPANESAKSCRKKSPSTGYTRTVMPWVVVTHILNPNHFYVQYVAEKREREALSKKITHLCSKASSNLLSRHTLDTGSLIFVKYEDGLWHRAKVMEVSQFGFSGTVKSCPVTQISSVHVFFIDSGRTTVITIKSEDRESDALLKAVNNYMRKVSLEARSDLDLVSPMAIRCSLKDLIPYDLAKGWSKEAEIEFRSMVNSSAVKMHIQGQDKGSLLVDLKKVPVNRASGPHISVREHLVFIEVARFYSPVTVKKKPLLYYPPVTPRIHTELNAVVSHINTPGDFYIQLVDNMESLLLTDKLQKYYSSAMESQQENLKIYCPVIGEACVALFEDKMWYRAQITGHPGGRKVEVVYVDFGNKEILPVTDLRKIKDEFFALPAMAIHCGLSDVIPLSGGDWSDACTSLFINLANQKLVTIVATAKGPRHGPVPVKLFESVLNGPLNNIGEKLVKEELALFKDSSNNRGSSVDFAIWDPPLELDLDNLSTSGKEPSSTEFEPDLRLPTQLKDVKVQVSHVNSPSSFYVQFTKYDSRLKRVCELLKQECAHREAEDVQWKAGMYCAAHINGVWERAQLCSDVFSDNIAEVIRCDHGNKAKLHIRSLLSLPPELVGSLALECTLCDIRPAGGRTTWTATACDFISSNLSGASGRLTAKEVSEERPVAVTLSFSNSMGQFVSIADFLVSKGLALRQRTLLTDTASSDSADSEKPKEAETTQNCNPNTPSTLSTPSQGSTLSALSTPFTPSNLSTSSVASSSSHSSGSRPKPSPRTFGTTEMIKTQPYEAPELPCVGHSVMTVSAVGEDGTIYTRTQKAERQLHHLKKRIQQSIKFNPCLKMYTWKTVQGCVIYGPDTLWYRGLRLELLGGHIKVQYVDYGHVETIPVVHVQPRLLFEDVPQLCVPCQLQGISPVGGRWQRDAVALLTELLLNRSVDVHILELPTDPRGPLMVDMFLDGLSINRIMSENNHGSLNQSLLSSPGPSDLSDPALLDDWDIDTEGLLEEDVLLGSFIYPELPPEGEDFPVRVKHLWTPNELFLWPLEGMSDLEINEETLDEAMDRVNVSIETLPRLNSFPQGGACLAEYSDGKYYRAKIMGISSAEPAQILVQHVDYGSDDTLPTSKLRQMPPDLLHFPTCALKVKVAGFRAPSVTRQDNMLPYSPEWSVRAVMDMTDLLHGCISATVVAREPELTVHLFNEEGVPVHMPLVLSGLAELD